MSLSGGDSRDYVGPVEYLNSSLLAIKHPEGRLAQGTTYEYFLTDHLGNIRAVVSPSSSGTANVTQWTEYDPWGMELAALSSGTSTNRDKFNGKENLAEIGNGMLDFGARLYDATIGRWGLIDPLAEKATHWSPYRFGFDNPVSVMDPTGMFEYSNGYTTQDSKDITGAMEFNGVFQNGGGDGPGKGKTMSDANGRTVSTPSNQTKTITDETVTELQAGFRETLKNGVELFDLVNGTNFSGINNNPDHKYIGGSPIGLSLGGTSQIAILAEANAGRQLSAMEAATKGAHFFSRHGAGTTLAQQEVRALTGLTPDGVQKGVQDASRFLSNQVQLQAVQRAQTIYNQTGRNVVNFNMEQVIGEGYLRGGSPVIQSSNVRAVFRNNNLITIFPVVRQ